MIIGIDLGTTNSLAAVFQNGESRLIHNALAEFMTPSVVGLDDEGRIITGRAAKDRLQTHPHQTVALFKRLMGSDSVVRLGDHEFKAQELAAFILQQLKQDAEAALGVDIEEAVITVPAYFNDSQRQMTKLAGRLAGFKVERLLNEPTAAALAYGAHEELDSQLLVFDLGGGTFDVSVLEMFDGVMEVRASAGDNRLGGEDFTRLIVQDFCDYLQQQGVEAQRLQQDYWPHLLAEAERAKIALSSAESYALQLQVGEQRYVFDYSRQAFEQAAEPLLQRLMTPVRQALKDSSIRVGELDQVLMVGGATRMPLIARMVARMFGRLPSRSVNPDEVVALGAACQAALKAQDQAIADVVLTDVCPYTLGIEVVNDVGERRIDGVFSPIIERNTVIPVSRSERYYTTHDQQQQVSIKVFQGEARQARDNIYLGKLEAEVPAAAAGEEALDVRFSYDINGLLEVETTIVSSNKTFSMVIANNQQLSEDDIQQSLKKLSSLKIHPRENSRNMAFLSRANRLYEQHLGEQREQIGRLIDYFNALLEQPGQQDIDQLRQQLERELEHFEL